MITVERVPSRSSRIAKRSWRCGVFEADEPTVVENQYVDPGNTPALFSTRSCWCSATIVRRTISYHSRLPNVMGPRSQLLGRRQQGRFEFCMNSTSCSVMVD